MGGKSGFVKQQQRCVQSFFPQMSTIRDYALKKQWKVSNRRFSNVERLKLQKKLPFFSLMNYVVYFGAEVINISNILKCISYCTFHHAINCISSISIKFCIR